ncbi:hypothetical protein MHU86_16315 [Fragilaria crotonensis]|nr:hypothetical protein MHU86_16315 [Fragilaria crotonensis]
MTSIQAGIFFVIFALFHHPAPAPEFSVIMSYGGSATSCCCGGCHKSFMRLSTHISLMPACNLHYTTSHDPKQQQQPIDANARLASVASLPTVNADNDVSSNNEEIAVYDDVSSDDRKMAAVYNDHSINDEEVDVDDNVSIDDEEEVAVYYDDVSTNNKKEAAVDNEIFSDDDEVSSNDEDVNVDDDEVLDSENNAGTGEPDTTSVLKLYDLLTALRSNPLEHAQFSHEEQVYISLLQLLKEIKAPLNSFTRILNWAAKSNEDGHQFKLDSLPTWEKMIQNLFVRYSMKGLVPKESFFTVPLHTSLTNQ